MDETIKIFCFGDNPHDWIASKDEAGAWSVLREMIGYEAEDYDKPQCVSDDRLDVLKFCDEDGKYLGTFREELDRQLGLGKNPPFYFAGTE